MGKKKVAQQITGEPGTEKIEAKAASLSPSLKKFKNIERARIYINASYNNTTITVTDLNGNVMAWASSGSIGFSGPKKATPFAASRVVSVVAEKIKPLGLKEVEILVKGVGSGRDSAIRSFVGKGFEVSSLRDVTPIPHNGPRPPKVRRV